MRTAKPAGGMHTMENVVVYSLATVALGCLLYAAAIDLNQARKEATYSMETSHAR